MRANRTEDEGGGVRDGRLRQRETVTIHLRATNMSGDTPELCQWGKRETQKLLKSLSTPERETTRPLLLHIPPTL